jgi:hypothetical protein
MVDLQNVGVIIGKINPFLFQRIKKVTNEINTELLEYKSKDLLHQFHRRLSGYDYDYKINDDLKKDISSEMLIHIGEHEDRFRYFHRMFNYVTDSKDISLELERMWINVQRKGEFLPLHQHSGVYSFVIWIQAPFKITDEEEYNPNSELIKNNSGIFQFIYTDALGKINLMSLPVDETWEGKFAVFPSELHHQVYPFYSTDEVRISLSGNFRVSIK